MVLGGEFRKRKKHKKRGRNALKKATGKATKIICKAFKILDFPYFFDVFTTFLFRIAFDGKRPV